MKTQDLDILSGNDDVVSQVEVLKSIVISSVTGGDINEEEYNRIRKLIIKIPKIKELVPEFLMRCRTLSEVWGWISSKPLTYAQRRLLIGDELNPILELLEYEADQGTFDFKIDYEEKQIIGNGGFGLVYLYEHRLLKLPFAVKVFAPAFYEGEQRHLERFFQESRMLFKLNHPSIIRIYDAGMIGKRPYIRMEYFKVKNLNQILNDYGILPPAKALIMMKNLADALRHAHEVNGIIHRDLKPSNIMAAPPNQFRIIDFGLGIFIEQELCSRLTKTGENIVSGYYNAPELIENPKLVDKRSDIYSLGAIWFTMLTGQPPAGSNFMDMLVGIEGISEEYINCVKGCLNNLETRIKDCNDLLNQLDGLI